MHININEKSPIRYPMYRTNTPNNRQGIPDENAFNSTILNLINEMKDPNKSQHQTN